MVALKSARRLAISAAHSLAKRFLSSGVTLVLPLGCRTKDLPSLKFEGVLGHAHELVPDRKEKDHAIAIAHYSK